MKGDEIKKMRLALKLSQEALAQRLGVSFKTVNSWERGVNRPSPLAVEKIKSLQEEQENV
jgi:DNA-binding transcriptional regulator YiaG